MLRAGVSPPPGSSAQLRRALRLVTALRDEAQGATGSLLPAIPRPRAGGNDLKEPSPPYRQRAARASPGAAASPTLLPGAAPLLGQLPTATELAAFADGSVAVSVIFPQSTGAASTENWADEDPDNPGDRRAFLLDRIDLALAWWASYLPGSRLTFVIPPAGALGAPQTVSGPHRADRAERRRTTSSGGARHDLSRLPRRLAAAEMAYGDAVRRANGTDWAFTVYVVDSLHDCRRQVQRRPRSSPTPTTSSVPTWS